jgi:protein phosphatase 2C family protein 2/3
MDCAVKYIVGRADEDRYTIATLTNEIKMYAVYDGHSGNTVVNYIQEHLAEKFNVALIEIDFNDEEVMKKTITDVFLEIDAEMESNWKNFQSGATANVVLRKGKKLYVANLADSRAIIFNSDGKILLETIDHDKQNQNEINRILALNAEMMYENEDHSLGRFYLAVTRGFGDFFL